jgi:hypothetical protein
VGVIAKTFSCSFKVCCRIARWYISIPKSQFLSILEGLYLKGKIWNNLQLFGKFRSYLVHDMASSYILLSFDVCVFPILVFCNKENLATLAVL